MARLKAVEKADLASRIKTTLRERALTQAQMAAICDVDQSLISRMLSMRVVRHTARTRRVEDYVNMQISKMKIPREAAEELRAFLSAGGTPILLRDMLRVLTRAARRL